MIRVERKFLSGRYADHSPSEWFGEFTFTWVRAPWGWMLFTIEKPESA
jgi:hypothetical protein